MHEAEVGPVQPHHRVEHLLKQRLQAPHGEQPCRELVQAPQARGSIMNLPKMCRFGRAHY
jgi:hypothetical protein